MTAKEYRDAIAALSLSQVGAAKVLGVNERTSRRWAEDGDVPRAAQIALRLMKHVGPKMLAKLGIIERPS